MSTTATLINISTKRKKKQKRKTTTTNSLVVTFYYEATRKSLVNNAIILVDHINRLRRRGLQVLDAIIQGALDRRRPILITSSTTVRGLLPLILFAKPEASIWYTLALATIGGLLGSTLLVLVVIPVGYVIINLIIHHKDTRDKKYQKIISYIYH